MRKLTNVYIEVTSRNANDLMKFINRYDLKPNTYIFFNYECVTSSVRTFVIPKNRKKVKLSVLKHLVDTIPTREEIISLKRQIGGYKTSIVTYKGDIDSLKRTINKMHFYEDMLIKNNKELLKIYNDTLEQLKKRKWWQIWK